MNEVTIRHTAKGVIIEALNFWGNIEKRWIPAAIWTELLAEHAGEYKGGWVADEDHPDVLWAVIANAYRTAARPLPGKVLA